jgi:threonine dehydratase
VPSPSEPSVPTIADLLAAQRRLAGIARCTPVMQYDDWSGPGEVLFKCENLQLGGAFKIRGAWNAMSQLDDEQRRRGVVTHSSGNHAQAVARAGARLGIPVTVVMPDNAPAVKREATRAQGATIVEYDAASGQRESISHELAARDGLTLIPPFDHPQVIAGQGTVGLELIAQAAPFDTLLVPCGGGGLLSGCAIACRAGAGRTRVIGIEPARADDACRSFRSGTLERIERPDTIADGTRTPSLGIHTFAAIRRYVDDMGAVSEAAIVEAVRWLYRNLRIVVEPSGGLGLAALLSGVVRPGGRTVVVLSGGNVDAAMMRKLLDPAVSWPG